MCTTPYKNLQYNFPKLRGAGAVKGRLEFSKNSSDLLAGSFPEAGLALCHQMSWTGGGKIRKKSQQIQSPQTDRTFSVPYAFFNVFVCIVMVFSDSLDSNITNTIYFLLKPFSVPLVSRPSATRWSVKKAQPDSFPNDNGQLF